MSNAPTEQNIVEFSPYSLLRNFSKNRVLPCVLAAVIAHVVVIGGLSYEFIYTTWIDPSASAEKATGNEGAGETGNNEKKAKGSGTESTDASVPEDDSARAAVAGKEADGAKKGSTASDDTRLDAPVVRDITDKADPDEIPDKPDDFGISIDDTNP
jgi:hypothetical protein